MPRSKRAVHTPGEQPASDGAAAPAAEAAPTAAAAAAKPAKPPPRAAAKPKVNDDDGPDADQAAQIAAQGQEIAQLRGLLQQLLESGKLSRDPDDPPEKPAKLIGDDLRPMSQKQVLEAIRNGSIAPPAGRPVMTTDGYLCL